MRKRRWIALLLWLLLIAIISGAVVVFTSYSPQSEESRLVSIGLGFLALIGFFGGLPAVFGAFDGTINRIVSWWQWRFSSPSFLKDPKDERRSELNLFDFHQKNLSFEGRDAEMQTLEAFAQHQSAVQVLYWWLLGGGGQGKSRLAYQWMQKLQTQGYDAGFYRGATAELKAWQPRRPTVIIIDDAADKAEETLELLRTLSERSDLRQPVRILLVERFVPPSLSALKKDPLKNHAYPPEALSVQPLSLSAIEKIADGLSEEQNWTKFSREELARVISTSEGQVLVVGLALYDIRDPQTGQTLEREKLIAQRAQLWIDKLSEGGVPLQAQRDLALSTFAGGVPWEARGGLYAQGETVPDNSGIYSDHIYRNSSLIPVVKPDIIGGAYVLKVFEALATDEKRRRFIRSAWLNNPTGTALSLTRLYTDFVLREETETLQAAHLVRERVVGLDMMPTELELEPEAQARALEAWIQVSIKLIEMKDIAAYEVALERVEDYLEGEAKCAAHVEESLASALFNACRFLGEARETEFLTFCFGVLCKLAENNKENEAIQLQLAKGAVNAISDYGEIQEIESMRSTLNLLAQTAEQNKHHQGIQLMLVKGAGNTIIFYGKAQEMGDMKHSLSLLKQMAEENEHNQEIQLGLIKGVGDTIFLYGEMRDMGDMKRSLKLLKQTAEENKHNQEIQLKLAKVVVSAINFCGEMQEIDIMADTLNFLERIAEEDKQNQEIQIELTEVLVNVVNFYGEMREIGGVKSSLSLLKQTAGENKHNQETQLGLVKGAANAISFYGRIQDIDIMTETVNLLKQTAQENKHNQEIQLALAKGAIYAIKSYSDVQRMDTMTDTLSLLEQTAQENKYNQEIQLALAKGAMYAISDYGNMQQMDTMTDTLNLLEQIAQENKHNQEIQLLLTKGATNAISHYCKMQQMGGVTATLNLLKQTAQENQHNQEIQLGLALGAVNAITNFQRQGWSDKENLYGILRNVIKNPIIERLEVEIIAGTNHHLAVDLAIVLSAIGFCERAANLLPIIRIQGYHPQRTPNEYDVWQRIEDYVKNNCGVSPQ